MTDRFNLTGLNTEVQYYQYALDLVTDVFDMEVDDEMREQIEKSARHLYGLVHARYVVTTRGLSKMVEQLPLCLYRTSGETDANEETDGKVQARRLRQMSSRHLRVPTLTTYGPTRRPKHINSETILR